MPLLRGRKAVANVVGPFFSDVRVAVGQHHHGVAAVQVHVELGVHAGSAAVVSDDPVSVDRFVAEAVSVLHSLREPGRMYLSRW